MIRFVLKILWIAIIGKPLPYWLPEAPEVPEVPKVLPGQLWIVNGIKEPVFIINATLYLVCYKNKDVNACVSKSNFLKMATLIESKPSSISTNANPGQFSIVEDK